MTLINNNEGGASVRAKLNTLFTDFANSEAKEVVDLTTLQADTSLTYTAGQEGTVVAGDIIRTRDGGVLQVAASSAVGVHAQTSNATPVKLIDLDFAKDARAHTSRLVERLENNDGNCAIVVFSDSTGDETFEWVYLLAGYIADKYPAFSVNYRLWDDGAGTYAAATSIQTGTGSNTLTIWNAALSGSTPDDWIGGRYSEAVTTRDPDLVLLSFGHNGGADATAQVNRMSPLMARVTLDLPSVPVILIGQNPTTTDDSMSGKVESFRALAARYGLGFINVHAAFRQSPTALASLMADTVHPNADGQQLWAKSVFSAFTGNGGASAAPSPSPMSGVISATHFYADFARWSVRGAGMSISEDSTNFETTGSGVKLTNASGANGWIDLDVVDSNDIKNLQGQLVTLAVRLKYLSGDASTGRIALYDGTTTVTSSDGGPQTGDFYWQLVTLPVGTSATYLRCYVYASTSAGAAEVTVDRAVIFKGLGFEDVAPPSAETFLRSIRAFANDPDGVFVTRNGNTGSRAITILSTIFGADDDDPETQHTVAIGGDLVSVKGRTDTGPRFQITPSSGNFAWSDGAGNIHAQLKRGGSALLTLSGAHFYPEADNTHDLGLSNKGWRRVHVGTEVRVANTKVVGAQQAAIADSVGGDEQAKINAILAAMRAHGLIAT